MRIAVISDTHADEATPWMQAVYERWLAPADLLLHTGDMTGRGLWSFFMQHPGFHAVAGNMCDWSLSRELEPRLTLTAGPVTVGMAHGNGFSGRPLWRSVAEAFGQDCGLVCFGHTHVPAWERLGATRVLNPGSLSLAEKRSTLALVDVGPDGSLTHELVEVPRSLG